MGWHMASHLPKLGHNVWVWNRTAEKAALHAQTFGTEPVQIQQAVQADIIFSCLPTSADVEALIALHPPKPESLWVDCTSGVPESAQRISTDLAVRGVTYLDAPVSGQTIGAERGTLTVMVGGNLAGFERAKPIIQAFAGLIEYVGESGAGFAVKAVNNTLMATHLWALSEGLSILKHRGVDLVGALSCINHSSGKSTMSETVMAQKVLSRTFQKTFALNLLQKDIGIALDLAEEGQMKTPVFHTTQELFLKTDREQATQMDFSAAVTELEKWNSLTLI
ncbi:NAD(P)-dependent oxidoreductase [Acinetobacter sp. WCHAc060042]|uniref:NAD(P)-dependent oxidoreductase n=1 Tax=Acinetobacter sp. WCHAc060042 TaxID=2213016 RepID=UPI003A599422